MKHTYSTPSIKLIDIEATELLTGSVPIGDINTGKRPGNENYDVIGGYNPETGGYGTGTPD